ncbi:MAG: phosphocarrier protein HPr [Gammaproteobacteria bacterium]|nr:phosphocarrier protein HPr [Gammaproteobacteria bacterium]|tara:strand:- start:296 stop:562 length:267 start_codon:yes stop_codon:yes gene_type:complete
MLESKVEVINNAGLHARAASKLASVSSRFTSTIKIGQEKMVDGKSILSLMMLAATKGSILTVQADGIDEKVALQAIISLINDRFGEAE